MMYERRSSKRLCALLVLLVLGQEFNHVVVTNALIDHHDNRAVYEDLDEVLNSNVLLQEHDKEFGPRRDVNAKEKRFLPALLFGVSIVTALVNVGLDVAMKKKGCCFFYKSICNDVKTFNTIKHRLGRFMKINNAQWKHVTALKQWIQFGNDKNALIWLEIKRIDDVQNKIVEVLGPDIIKKFNTEENRLQQSVLARNRTALGLTYKQLSDRFEEPFNSAKDTAMRLSGVTGLVGGQVASSAFKYYKIRQISKVLQSSYGAKLVKAAPAASKVFGFTKSSVSMHIQQTSKSIFKAKFSTAGKFMKGAGVVMSVASIAMDVYSIVQKVKGCQKVRDRASESVRDIRKAEEDAKKLYYALLAYRVSLIYNGIYFIKRQLLSSDLHTVLRSFHNLATSAPQQANNFRSAAPVISLFLAKIGRATLSQIPHFQVHLIVALRKITIYYLCYLLKLNMVKYVTDNCVKGTSSMQDLFNRGNHYFNSNNQYCRLKNGFAYTTFNSVQAVVSSDVQKKGLNPDCIMNSQQKKKEVCGYKNSGYTVQQIASKAGLSGAQVQGFIKACPVAPITPAKVQKICDMRKDFNASDGQISKITGITVARVATVKCK